MLQDPNTVLVLALLAWFPLVRAVGYTHPSVLLCIFPIRLSCLLGSKQQRFCLSGGSWKHNYITDPIKCHSS